MPQISRFLGIKIYFYYNDHPPPHFQAIYGEYQADFDINTLGIISGKLPNRVRALVVEWAASHQDELQENWQRARDGLPLHKIAPLV